MRYKLRLEEHEDFSTTGIKVIGSPDWMEPCTDGRVLAHDLIEHPSKRHSNCYIDELYALGAGYVWRYMYIGAPGNPYRPLEVRDFAGEVVNMFEGLYDVKVYHPRKSVKILHNFVPLVDGITKELLECQEYMDLEERLTREDAHLFARNMVSYMQKGAGLFYKRFARVCLNDLYYNVFQEIENQANRFIKHYEEGDEAALSVVFSTGKVSLEYTPYEED